LDWYGNWDFNDWDTTTVWGTEPSGGEWYDVEAMYLDNDADNIYAVIVTSCPFYYDWSFVGGTTGVGIYEPRYSSYPIYKWILPGDLCIDLGNHPRDERGATETSYDYGVDIVHEQRNPKDPSTTSIWHDSRQHSVEAMRDNNVGYKLYKTTADPGGENIGDPYLDIPGNPKYDWYTANVHEVSEWQHTNFDPFSSWGDMPSSLGDATVYYYEYTFPGGHEENNAGTFIIEVTIPRSLFGADNPGPGDTIGIQWVTGCRNEGIKTASTSHVIKGTIGDFVWNDENANGCQDAGELGISNVKVELYESGGVTPIDTTWTNSAGYYSFTADPGDYYIKFIPSGGWVFTTKDACADDKDSDVDSSGTTDVFTLNPGADIDTIDAGLYAERAEIGDKVWHDLDGDGIQDAGEPGINNVKVELYKSDHTYVGTAWTNSNGIYKFTNLEPGSYYLKFYIPSGSGYLFTLKDMGANDKDSDADTSTGLTMVTTLSAGETDYTWDCGMYKKGKIGDYVWEDMNGNGIQDDGATGISGVTVQLYHWSGGYITSVVTNSTGYYEFDVDPGDYYVKFLKPSPSSDWVFTSKDSGGNDNIDSDTDSSGKTAKITITFVAFASPVFSTIIV